MLFKTTTFRHWSAFFLTVLVFHSACAQTTPAKIKIEVSKNQRIASVENGLVWIEPHLATDPQNKDFLIATSFNLNKNDFDQTTKSISIFRSLDRGQSWEKNELDCLDCTDPWLTITKHGIIFLTTMGQNLKSPDKDHIYNILVFTSSDNGATWSKTPQIIEGYFDGPKAIAADDGTFYLLAQGNTKNSDNISRSAIYLGRAEPGQLRVNTIQNLIPSNLNLNTDMPAVLSDGSLYISYFDLQRKADGGFNSRAGRLKKRRAWAIKSKDRGNTFSEDLFITEEAAFRPNSMISSPRANQFSDRLFFASVNQDLSEIIFLFSPDKGDEWIQTKIEAAADLKRSRFIPQIAVNQEGTIAIAWYDYRESNDQSCYAPYISISTDGGKTFTSPQKISPNLSCAEGEDFRTGRRWSNGGDYFGLSASADGTFHMIWPDARSGQFELWYSSIKVSND